jgi:hypothetical protein
MNYRFGLFQIHNVDIALKTIKLYNNNYKSGIISGGSFIQKKEALVSTTATTTAETPKLQIALLPRPGTPERRQYEEKGVMPSGYSDSSMELNWCLAPEVLEYLKRFEIELYMLVVVESNGNEKSRQIVPFTKGYCQVMFPSIGLNTVHVTGVWRGSADLREALFSKERGSFETDVLEQYQPGVADLESRLSALRNTLVADSDVSSDVEEDEIHDARYDELRDMVEQLHQLRRTEPRLVRICELYRVPQLDYQAIQSVEVNEEMFATHWSITKQLANLYPYFKKRRSPDGCNDRKRAIFTGLTFWWAYVLYLLVKSVVSTVFAFIGLFFGLRELDFTPIVKPHGRVPADVQRYCRTSTWFENADGSTRGFHLLWVANPPFIALSGLLAAISVFFWAWLANPRLGWTDRFVQLWTDGPWWFYVVVVLGPALVAAAVLVVTGLAVLFGYASKIPSVAHFREQREVKRQARDQADAEKYYAEVARLTCGTGDVLKRPVEKKPILLRPIEYGKMRVCKPNPR